MDHKSKKRKASDDDIQDTDKSAGGATSTSGRVILKARSKDVSKVPVTNVSKGKTIDTPAMRKMREKILEKKTISSKTSPSKYQPLGSSKDANKNYVKSTQRHRLNRSLPSSQSSISSNCSSISKASSLGSKIQAAAAAAAATIPGPSKNSKNSSEICPKIKEINVIEAEVEANHNSNDLKRKSFKRNAAEERLENLRRRLSMEEEVPNKRTRTAPNKQNNINFDSAHELSKLLNTPCPRWNKNAHARLSCLEHRIERNGLLNLKNIKGNIHEEIDDQRLQDKLDVNDSYCEEMEWESIDEQIMSEVCSF